MSAGNSKHWSARQFSKKGLDFSWIVPKGTSQQLKYLRGNQSPSKQANNPALACNFCHGRRGHGHFWTAPQPLRAVHSVHIIGKAKPLTMDQTGSRKKHIPDQSGSPTTEMAQDLGKRHLLNAAWSWQGKLGRKIPDKHTHTHTQLHPFVLLKKTLFAAIAPMSLAT